MSSPTSPEGLPPDANRIFREYLTAVVLHGQTVAEAMELHPTDAYAMNLLAVLGPLSIGELAARTGLTTGAATRLVDRLEAADAVRRARDPADRRRVIIEVPASDPRRAARADAVLGPAREAIAEVFRNYGPDQLALLFDFFRRSTDALRNATNSLPR